MTLIQKTKKGSFLTVLKKFGKKDNDISFPIEGFTLACDFALNKKTFDLLKKCDLIVKKYNGKIYLAKDCRMTEEMFKSTYKEISAFQKEKNKVDPEKMFESLQSKRIGI